MPLLATCCLLLATCYLLLTTYYLLPGTLYTCRTTYYLLLTPYYLLLYRAHCTRPTTYYLLLTTVTDTLYKCRTYYLLLHRAQCTRAAAEVGESASVADGFVRRASWASAAHCASRTGCLGLQRLVRSNTAQLARCAPCGPRKASFRAHHCIGRSSRAPKPCRGSRACMGAHVMVK